MRTLVFTALAVGLGLLVIEGVAAVVLSALGEPTAAIPVAERRHTRYDEELGWVNEPSLQVKDLYGPGRTLTTNAQGFRATHDFDPEVPAGRVRILCSGDSFTLGWGVDDQDTWCAALERVDPRIQTVNQGQGGYGVDQAYLWALREEDALDHQVHVFAFISEDFQRMRYDRFFGYGKPMLQLVDEVPTIDGVPVPRPAGSSGRWWAATRTGRLILRVTARSVDPAPEPRLALSEATRIGVAAIAQLHRDHERRGRQFVAVWLTTLPEYQSQGVDPLRETVIANLRAAGVRTIDLTGDFRSLSPSEVEPLFLLPNDALFPAAGRHYSELGNEFVAEALWKRLQRLPEFSPAERSP
ncbi:MAG: hypothetical protein DHS20C21_08990 [Gemmatimonadota bacterium]|nr:MAG: hypothetical protein DHS20C21_08990 [Gemmatimonadota bacterium]